jgi:hypothetical protein
MPRPQPYVTLVLISCHIKQFLINVSSTLVSINYKMTFFQSGPVKSILHTVNFSVLQPACVRVWPTNLISHVGTIHFICTRSTFRLQPSCVRVWPTNLISHVGTILCDCLLWFVGTLENPKFCPFEVYVGISR